MTAETPPATRRLAGKELAATLLERTRARAEGWKGRFGAPTLASVAVGEGSPFAVYQRQQGKQAERAGITFRPRVLPEGVSRELLQEELLRLDRDESVDGVILQHPLPPGLDFVRAISTVRAVKDIDGVGPANLGALVARRPGHVPAVALASRDLLVHHGIATAGRRVVVVGRSGTVGIPTALLLLLPGPEGDASVTVVHSRSQGRDALLQGADVIVSCAGQPRSLTRRNVSRGATVIDVGLSTVPDPSRPQESRIAGDADAADLDGWAGALTPVPGGVGPVTVAELMANVLRGYALRHGLEGTS